MEFKLKGGQGLPQLSPAAPYILMIPGAGLVLFGIVLLTNPWLLVYMVAGVFILLGALLTLAGWRAKKMMG